MQISSLLRSSCLIRLPGADFLGSRHGTGLEWHSPCSRFSAGLAITLKSAQTAEDTPICWARRSQLFCSASLFASRHSPRTDSTGTRVTYDVRTDFARTSVKTHSTLQPNLLIPMMMKTSEESDEAKRLEHWKNESLYFTPHVSGCACRHLFQRT